MNRDWRDFKSLHSNLAGAREAFEDACETLFRKMYPLQHVSQVKVKHGDGGIDVFIGELGKEPITVIQCKFFLDSFGDSQKAQIRKSFKSTLSSEKYQLKNWILCVPNVFDIDENSWWFNWKHKQLKENSQENNFIDLINGNELIDLLKEHDLYNQVFQIEDSKKIDEIHQKVIQGNSDNKTPKELTTILPRLPKEKIVGRTNDLEDLKKRLFQNKQVVLMNGMGGIGKTTLAKVYLTENFDKYNHIAWIKSSDDDFVNDLISAPGLLESMKLKFDETSEKTFNRVILDLKNLPGKCLMIIDDAKENLANYIDILPNHPSWHLLVTSRQEIPYFDIKKLDFLDEEEAVELFKFHYTREKISNDEIKSLVQNIEYHTLTIEILAKTAQELRTTPEELDKAIKNNIETDIKVKHTDKKIEKVFSYLMSIFDLSNLPQDEVTILKYISVLPSEYIPFDMLKEVLDFVKGILVGSLNGLSKKGWLLYNEKDDTYKLHQIILDVVKSKYTYYEKFMSPIIDSIGNKLKVNYSKDNPIDKFKWIPYGKDLLNFNESNEVGDVSTLQNNLALRLQDLGDYEGAKALLEKAVLSTEKNFGIDHPSTAISYSNLALVLQDLGDYEGAKTLLEKAVLSAEKNFGIDHPSTAIRYSNLATVLQGLGDYEGAKTLLEKAVLSAEKNFGIDHPSTAIRYSNLALVLKDLGDYEGAWKLLEKAVASDEKNFGKDHPSTAISYSNLALVLQALDDYEGARKLLEKAYDIFNKGYGEDHPNSKIIKGNLDHLLEIMNRSSP